MRRAQSVPAPAGLPAIGREPGREALFLGVFAVAEIGVPDLVGEFDIRVQLGPQPVVHQFRHLADIVVAGLDRHGQPGIRLQRIRPAPPGIRGRRRSVSAARFPAELDLGRIVGRAPVRPVDGIGAVDPLPPHEADRMERRQPGQEDRVEDPRAIAGLGPRQQDPDVAQGIGRICLDLLEIDPVAGLGDRCHREFDPARPVTGHPHAARAEAEPSLAVIEHGVGAGRIMPVAAIEHHRLGELAGGEGGDPAVPGQPEIARRVALPHRPGLPGRRCLEHVDEGNLAGIAGQRIEIDPDRRPLRPPGPRLAGPEKGEHRQDGT